MLTEMEEKMMGNILEFPSFTFQWSIRDNFRNWLIKESGMRYFSPDFQCGDTTWCLCIYPNGLESDDFGWISLYLIKRKSTHSNDVVTYTLGLKHRDGVDYTRREVVTGEFGENGIGRGCHRFIKLFECITDKNILATDDVLNIYCNLSFGRRNVWKASQQTDEEKATGECTKEKEEQEEESSEEDFPDPEDTGECTKEKEEQEEESSEEDSPDPEDIEECSMEKQTWKEESCKDVEKNDTLDGVKKMTEDFKELLLDESDCDVILKVKDRDFGAHMLILGVRSPVFRNMFKHGTGERISGIVDIPDCDPDSFRDFLLYLYSGKVEKLNTCNAINLYSVAEKYGLDDLKLNCLHFIEENLSVDTFGDVIALALQYNEPSLLKTATAFFTKNKRDILVTEKWLSFMIKNPIACNDLHIKSLNSIVPK